MPEGKADATVALRLELGRMTDKANALEAALRKEVAAVIAQEVAKAKACDAEIAKLKAEACDAEIAKLKAEACDAEIAKLKAEVALWQIRSENWQKLAGVAMAEAERLKGGQP